MVKRGTTDSQRFDSRTCYAGDCIVWTGADTGRYGVFIRNGVHGGAHRFAYERVYGPIPDGLVIDHLCRNTFCVNPAHLEAVQPRVNTKRGASNPERLGTMHAAKTHCPQGHPYFGANLYQWRNYRYCRACINERTVAYNRRKRQGTK